MWSRVHGFNVCFAAVYFNISSPLHTSFSHAYRSGMHLNVPCPTERVCVYVFHICYKSRMKIERKNVCLQQGERVFIVFFFSQRSYICVIFNECFMCRNLGWTISTAPLTQTLPVTSSFRSQNSFFK